MAQIVDAKGNAVSDTVVHEVYETPTSISGLLGSTISIAAYYTYNNQTCQVSSDGTWTVTTPPHDGTISSALVNLPIENSQGNPGNCNGTIIPQNVVSYTFSAGYPQKATESFSVTCGTSVNSPYITYDVTANRGPRLFLTENGQDVDVTGQATTVSIGQLVDLYIGLTGYAPGFATASWNANDKKVEYWTNTTDPCNPSVPCPVYASNNFADGVDTYAYVVPGTYNVVFSWTERWPAKFGQPYKWNPCLRAAIVPRHRSKHGETGTADA